MTSVVALTARISKIQKDSLSSIAGAQSVGRTQPQRRAISMLLDRSRLRIMSLLVRTFTHWSRSIQRIYLDRTAFDPLPIVGAFLAALNSQVGSAYLQQSSLEDFLDWEIVVRNPARLMRQTTGTNTPTASGEPPARPLMTYEMPSPSRLFAEAEMPRARVEPTNAEMEELAESVGSKVGTLHRVAYINYASHRRAAHLVADFSKPVDWLITKSDGLQRRFRDVQIPPVISGAIPDTFGMGPLGTSLVSLRGVPLESEGPVEEALEVPPTALQTGLLARASTGRPAASALRRLVQGLGLPLRLLRTAYSRYFLPQKSLTLGVSAVAPAVSEMMPEIGLTAGQSAMQAPSMGVVPSHEGAFTYVFTFVPTLDRESASRQVIPFEIPLFPKTYAAAIAYMHGTAETTRNLSTTLPSSLSTTLLLSENPLYMPEGRIGHVTTAAGIQAVSPTDTERVIEDRFVEVNEIRKQIDQLKQGAFVIQRRFAQAMNAMTGSALRARRFLTRTMRRLSVESPGPILDSRHIDSMRDRGGSRIPQLLGGEGLPYENVFSSGLIGDIVGKAATSDAWPRMISTASEYLRLIVDSDIVLRARSGLSQDQAEVNEPYTTVMKNLIAYASASAPSTMVVPPQVPEGLPSAKLHEAVSFILSTQRAAPPEAPSATRREPVVHKPLPVTIEVDSLRDEAELRELQRKIARIIKDEARRHGVYS